MLLATKFLKPALAPRSVIRPRLLERLAGGHAARIATVTAPAGYGKTTLINQWCAATDTERKVAWLAVDSYDNDPRRFWQYFIGALGQEILAAQELNQRLAELDERNLDAIITAIINAIAGLPGSYALVLDDYHAVENPVVHRQVGYLVDYLPPHFMLVITSRTEPPLPLARWRVRGWLREVNASDLAFCEEECAQFFGDYMAMSLSAESIHQLWRQTEGWAAAMQLAALSGPQGSATSQQDIIRYGGHQKHVSDYVLTEILDQQPEDVREFLLTTACCHRLSPTLCNVLLGRDDSASRLEALVKANLFIIPLDTNGYWYRYHDLFREALCVRACSTDPAHHAQLLRKASQWFLEHDHFLEAISHLIELKDWDWLAQVLEQHGNNLIHEGYHLNVVNWLDALPQGYADDRPRLLMIRVWALFFANKLDLIEPLLERLEALVGKQAPSAFQGDPQDAGPPNDHALDLHSEVALVYSYLARMRSDLDSATDLTRDVLRDIDHTDIPLKSVTYYGIGLDSFARGDLVSARQALSSAIDHGKREKRHSTVLSSGGLMAWILFYQGEMELALETCSTVRAWVDSFHTDASQPQMISCWQNSSLTQIYRERNDLELARTYLNPLLEHVAHGTEPGQHIVIQYVRAHLDFSQKKYESAITALEDAENVLARKGDAILFEPPCLEALRVRCLLGLGELDKARAWADKVTPERYRNPINREQVSITIARVRVATGEPERAIAVLNLLRLETEKGEHIKHLIELLAVYATALAALGRAEDATTILERGLELAARDGFTRLLYEEGPALAIIYRSVEPTGLNPGWVRQLDELLLEPSSPQISVKQPPTAPAGTDLLEPLSQRELEVLALIHEGLSNKVIAQKLDVAPTTVKAHIRNLYGKLGTSSRTEALAKARGLGLLQ